MVCEGDSDGVTDDVTEDVELTEDPEEGVLEPVLDCDGVCVIVFVGVLDKVPIGVPDTLVV